jgi:hypothetical protein
MKYIAVQQAPLYRYNGSVYTPVGSVEAGTEITFKSVYADKDSGREVGLMEDGRRIFLDSGSVAPLLPDTIQVNAKRMYLGLWIAGGFGAAYWLYTKYGHKLKKLSS